MANRRIALVTGAAGFIGSHLCEALVAEGWSVRGVDSFTDYYDEYLKRRNLLSLEDEAAFDLIEQDLCFADLDPVLAGASAVFHLAAQPGVRRSWGTEFAVYVQNNIIATQRVLEALRQHRIRLINSSSSSVYGSAESLPTQETHLPRPVSPYGVTKLAAENLCRLYSDEMGVETVSLRYFTVYGPRQRPDMAFRRFLEAAVSGTPIVVHGSGEQSRDFTYVNDVVDANLRAERLGVAGRSYNIGGGAAASVMDVVALIRAMLPGPVAVKRDGWQAGDARHTSADTSLARRDLGFLPRTTLRDGLRRQYEWVRQSHGSPA